MGLTTFLIYSNLVYCVTILRNSEHNLTQPSYNNRYYHNSFTYKASHLWNQLPSYIKRSTEQSELCKNLRSFNLINLRTSCNVIFVYVRVFSLFLGLLVFNFHLFLYIYDVLKLNLLKCIVLLLTIFFVIRFHT